MERFRYPFWGFIIPLEGFRYPSWGFKIPLEGVRYCYRLKSGIQDQSKVKFTQYIKKGFIYTKDKTLKYKSGYPPFLG